MHSSHSLELIGLTKRYGSHKAIDGVSVQVNQGEFVTLLGPSGSGKTTLLMAVAGFVEPESGQILLDRRDITHVPPEKRDFGMVFQGYALFPHMTVAENVGFPLRVRGTTRSEIDRRVAQILDLVQMAEFAKRLPPQLSGGQQQRVALARALVFQPALLLLDEPLSALDKSLRADLQWELRALHRRLGTTFIYVTHDQEEALSMSDSVVILRNGRVQQIGSPIDLYTKPRTKFVASFLGESNFFSGECIGSDGNSFTLSVAGHIFHCAGGLVGSRSPQRITVAVRPERIDLAIRRPGEANVISGRVIDLKYLGASIHAQVEVSGLGTITAKVAATTLDINIIHGAEVLLSWAPEAAVVVND